MTVNIVNRVPVLRNGKVESLSPGQVIDGLDPDVEEALIRGGDAELVHTPEQTTSKQEKEEKVSRSTKARSSAPETKAKG